MLFNIRLWPLGLAFFCSILVADCGPEPEGFEPWPEGEAVPEASIPHANWFRSEQGWVVAPDRCQAVEAAWEREEAFEAFERHFARVPLNGAVVDVKHAAVMAAIREAGAAWALPWRFAAAPDTGALEDSRIAAIRAQIESQLASAGTTPEPEQVDKLLENVLSQMAPATESRPGMLAPKAMRHEIAHLLFIEGVWPSTRPGGTQYGGDAPDWLDEIAAVAAEAPEMTAGRRDLFRQAARDDRLIPLERYLSMVHPVFGNNDFRQLLLDARETAQRDGADVVSAAVGSEQIAKGRIFYAQSRGWLDFLLEQTANPQILGVIADAMKAGLSFEEWLIEAGSGTGLPNSLDALETAFLAWALMQG